MGNLIKKILIATDGSSRGRKATQYGIELAKLAGAEVLGLFVLDVKSGCSLEECITITTPTVEVKSILHERGERALQYIEDLTGKESVKFRSLIVEGNPSEQIIEVAKKQSADLIVMGTLGATGISKFLIGSVADRVVTHSPIPVLTVRK